MYESRSNLGGSISQSLVDSYVLESKAEHTRHNNPTILDKDLKNSWGNSHVKEQPYTISRQEDIMSILHCCCSFSSVES
jgi:hypothetical protein